MHSFFKRKRAKNDGHASVAVFFIVCAMLAAGSAALLRYQAVHGRSVFARVRAALTSVSLNGGTTEVTDATNITSATTGLAPDIGAYRWTVGGNNISELLLPFVDGVTQTDFSGNGRNGTAQNGAAYSGSGKVGGAISLDGTDDYLSFASVPGFYPMTMSAWINPTDNTDRVIVDDNGTFSGMRLSLNSSGNLVFDQFDNTPAACVTATSASVVPASSWTLITVRRQQGGQIAVYINGVFEAASTISSNGANNLPSDFKIGQGASRQDCLAVVPPNFQGLIDEFQIYNRILSNGEIAQLYADGNAGVGGPTLIHANDTTVGDVWNLSVTPISSAGIAGSPVTSSNTVTVSNLTVSSITPAHHAKDVTRSSNIVIVFNRSLNSGTVTSTTLPVYGSYSGLIAGAYTFSTTTLANDTVTFNPTSDFLVNEHVEAVLTASIQSSGGIALERPYVYDFTVEVTANGAYVAQPTFSSTVTTVFDYGTALGDFNNDGTLDFMLSPEGPHASEAVVVFQGNGDGTFTEQYRDAYAFNTRAWHVGVADFNRDGNLDMAVGSVNLNQIYVYLGDGSFGFTKSTITPVTGCCVYGVVVSDFNADGNQDIAVPEINNNKMAINLGNGTGGFAAPVAYATNTDRMLTAGGGDFNNDAYVDLLGPGYSSSDFSIVLNNGNGTFQPGVLYASPGNTQNRVYVNDFNGDGDLDFAAQALSGSLVFMNNTGAGAFTLNTNYAGTTQGLVGGDIDADGDLDVVYQNGSGSGTLRLNDGSGGFASTSALTLAGSDNMAVGDLDNDGSLDLITINKSTQNVHVYLRLPADTTAPSITLVRPNGGENVTQGSTYSIQWYATDDTAVSSVALELTTNNSTYNPIAGAGALANGTSYPAISTLGSAGTGNGQFASPRGAVVDSAGNLYVMDSGNARVQKFDANGNFLLAWGSAGTGNGQFSNISFGGRGMAVDSSDNIYVTDTDNNRIQKFDSSGNFITKWGTFGSGDGQFRRPFDVALDASDNVYVVELNSPFRLQKFTSAGAHIVTLLTSAFIEPRGVAVDSSGNIYVAVAGTDRRIYKYDPAGTELLNWGGFGTGPGQFDRPLQVRVDADDNVYVADSNGARVQKFTSSGVFILQFGTAGSASGELNFPEGMGVTDTGFVFVADTLNHRVQKFGPGGAFSWSVPVTTTSLARIRATAVDAASNSGQDTSDAVFSIVPANAAPQAPTNLYSNNTTAQLGATNPASLSDTTPAFSAICNDPDAGDILDKYQIQVDNDPNFSSVVWDSGAAGTAMSGCTAGSRSADIDFGGTPLALDGATYYWRIKFWDDSNTEGSWSEEPISTNTFTMQTASGTSIQRIQQANLPSAPSIGVASPVSGNSIRWEFTDTSSNETGFKLIDGEGNQLSVVQQPDLTHIDETGLAPNTSYAGRRVVAFNNAGDSAESSVYPSVATLMPVLQPVAAATGPSFITASVQTVPPNLSVGQSAIRFELLSAASGAQAASLLDSGWIQAETYTFTDLASGDYLLRVNARNQAGVETGWSPYSEPIQTTEQPQGRVELALDLQVVQAGRLVLGGDTLDPREPLSVSIRVANAGSVAATNVFANLLVPPYLMFDRDTLRISGTAQSSAADGDAGQGNGNAVSAIWERLQPGEEHLVSFILRFDEQSLRALASNAAAAGNPTVTLQASVSSSESEEATYSAPLSFTADASVYAPAPAPVEPEPVVEPEPAAPVRVPTPEETAVIENVVPIITGGDTSGGPTQVTTGTDTFGVEVSSGEKRLLVNGMIETVGDQIQFNGTTNLPFTVITLILNDSVLAITVSDADGRWQTYVDAEQVSLALGDSKYLLVEAIAANGDLRSDRVRVGEVLVSREQDGEVIARFDQLVSASGFVDAAEQVLKVIKRQEPAIRKTLAVAAPVVIVSSVPLWGYAPYMPALAYHLLTYAVGLLGRKKRNGRFHGMVYDSISKRPLSLAIVRIYRVEGERKKLVTTTVSDKLGRYDALVEPGTYHIEATKPLYVFPSQVVRASEDGEYKHVYEAGSQMQVTDESGALPDLPLDPIHAQRRWELASAGKKLWLAVQRVGNHLAAPVLLAGSVVSTLTVASSPERTINWFIAVAYVLLLVLHVRLRTKPEKPWGIVYDVATNAVLPLVTVQLIDQTGGKVVLSRLSDYQGRFAFLPEPGIYFVKASKPGFLQVSEPSSSGQTGRQPLTGPVSVEKRSQRLSGDIAMRQSA